MLPSPGEQKLSLIVVGTGIRAVGQLTIEAMAWIRKAEKVLYVVADPVAEDIVRQLNPTGAESLAGLYAEGKPRTVTYEEMVEQILACVRGGAVTCVAAYGHPGVFAYPAHEAIRRARAEGYAAKMLPGISAEDCLFADLGIDPSTNGCASFEATDFLMNGRTIDPTSSVILWQIGVVGDWTFRTNGYDLSALPILAERLCEYYPPDHLAFLYEAAVHWGCEPLIRPVSVASLPQSAPSPLSTLYIPPARPTMLDQAAYGRLAAMKALRVAQSSFNHRGFHAFSR
jgi:uncharacterized protein YabN with tetrapyrrole methylase and pyrophosphatase domain